MQNPSLDSGTRTLGPCSIICDRCVQITACRLRRRLCLRGPARWAPAVPPGGGQSGPSSAVKPLPFGRRPNQAAAARGSHRNSPVSGGGQRATQPPALRWNRPARAARPGPNVGHPGPPAAGTRRPLAHSHGRVSAAGAKRPPADARHCPGMCGDDTRQKFHCVPTKPNHRYVKRTVTFSHDRKWEK